ncbi:MAG TPA: hypothetical protein VEC16_01305 [Alphaproteobacteria bacterium]|nr:hypothetical protein [Alphaproteobacteria bacterium]
MNVRLFSIFAVLILLFAGTASALPIVKYNQVDDSIDENDNTAVYRFSITNTDKSEQRFQFYTISAFWDIDPSIVSVQAGATAVFDMEITLNDDQLVGPQLVPVTIKILNDDYTTVENLYVYIKPQDAIPLSYVPNIAAKVSMKDQLDPREPVSVEISMTNRNPLNISDLRIVIESQLFSKEVQTSLLPLESKTNQVLLSLNELQEPGIYIVTIKLITNNKTITQVQKEVKVLGYSEISIEQTKIKGLFSYTERIKVHNDGNYEAVKQVRVEKNFLEKIFTTSSARSTKLREDGVSYLKWDIPLRPQESYELTVKTNYTILAVIFILIVAGIIAYYIFRSPVLLYKRAKIVASTSDGITEIKVKLHLKNRSGNEIKAVKVIDRYPKIVSLVEDESIGAMKPTKMLSGDKVHSLLMWNLESLEPYEERLLTYTIRSKLDIVGSMHLKTAKVRFNTPAGERTTSSNDVILMHRAVDTIKYE